MRSEYEINQTIDTYADMVKRICFVRLKNKADTEDIFQNVFLKYAKSNEVFTSNEHLKAWLIRVTINECNDLLKSFFRRNTISIDEVIEHETKKTEYKEVYEEVLRLPRKYKDVVYLYYYEAYSAKEIAEILNKNVNTVYTLLNRAKALLKERLIEYVE